MIAAMCVALRVGLGAVIAFAAMAAAGRAACAMDCPCTWEAIVCEADAVAELEMVLATKTTPDRLVVRRVIWNRTKHRIRAAYGQPNIPHVTKTRDKLLGFLAAYRLEGPHTGPVPETMVRYRRAVERGRYRTIAFLRYAPRVPWFGGGVGYSGAEWLDHPRHAEWWAAIQPYLKERIEADERHETPAFCGRVRREDGRIEM